MRTYYTQLIYTGLRRRVVARLAGANALLLHCAAFTLVNFALAGGHVPVSSWSGFPYFVDPNLGALMTVWSVLLATHMIYGFTHSAAQRGARTRAIDSEIAHFQQQETGVQIDAETMAKLSAALDADVQRHNLLFVAALLFAILNTVLWVTWAVTTPRIDATAWSNTMVIALASVISLGAAETMRAFRRRGAPVPFAQFDLVPEKAKRKREEEDSPPTRYELGDDGEIMPYVETGEPLDKPKRLIGG